MKRRIISFVLIIAFLVTFIAVRPLFDKDNVVYAEEYRNGYALIPQKNDGTGIDTSTTFLLKAEGELTTEIILQEFSITPKVTFNVTEGEDGYIIKPDNELEKNKIYTFKLKDATWTFQTMSTFKILGTLPGNQSTSVPMNSGIEFYFTHANVEIDKYFDIEPSVKGTFEAHGNTVVFVPKELEEKTIYTVTLKSGLALDGSNQALSEDYVFTFETASKDESDYKEPNGYFNFNNILNDFAVNEAPKIPMNYYINDSNTSSPIKAEVFAYSSIEEFTKAIDDYNGLPYWSYYNLSENFIETKGLNKAISFEQKLDLNTNQQFLNIPESLPSGYYLVDCTWEDIQFQTFIQVTNLSYFFMNAKGSNLIWVNDLATQEAVVGALIQEHNSNVTVKTDEDGIALLEEVVEDQTLGIYEIQSEDQSAIAILNNYSNTFYYGDNQNLYWRYLQTDRNLYQPDDTISFWGFLKHRYADEKVKEVTVEISNQSWYYSFILPYEGADMPFVSEEFDVENGFYEGTLDLPNLEEGSYQISVKFKDETISTNYITVQKYIKPAYKIEIAKDKEAVFVGEPINFTAKTSFFEGTPVANLDVNYNISGNEYLSGLITTNSQGENEIIYTPKYIDGYQGLNYTYMSAYANLPESGQIYSDSGVSVFMNDIEVSFTALLENNKGTLTAQVNKIDLDRLNDGTAKDQMDYLGDVIEGQKITGTIYKNEWLKREVGEYYDFINKIVVPQYEYYTEQTVYQNIEFVTDALGKAILDISFDTTRDCYYTVNLTTQDSAGKEMKFEQYFGENWYYNSSDYDYFKLVSEKDTFTVDEEIEVRFMNNEEILPQGKYLYIKAQNGILSYDLSDSSSYKTSFDASLVPNAEIVGVYFNGKTYVKAESFNPRLDTEHSRIEFTVETDKKTYKPGEIATVTLQARIFSTELNDYIVAEDVIVNISIVDEALFKLSDQSIDTLASLYEWVPSGIMYTYSSHRNEGNYGTFPMAYGMGGRDLVFMDENTTTEETQMSKADGTSTVRSEFKDTAFFTTIHLDSTGKGTFSYKLPDNVTSWRMTFAGISPILMAGTSLQEVIVTMPYFINASLNQSYLVGDQPFVGVTSYGNELKEGEEINYTVSIKENNYSTTFTGKAFERVNIPLSTMAEGTYHIVIEATTASGYSDAIEETIKVVKTYHQSEIADYYDIKEGMQITTTDEGNTKITFLDQGKGKFMTELYNLAYSSGKRVDQKYLALLARNLLIDEFGVTFDNNETVELTDYQMDDGGYGILPYSESDIETTVKLIPLIADEVNNQTLKMYLYNALKEDTNNKAILLYGLALLGEPIVLELDELKDLKNVSLKDSIYLSLAYAVLGDSYQAKEIYQTHISSFIETYQEVARINYGSTNDSYKEYTALLMLLASKLDLENKNLLFDYVTTEYSDEILVNTEILTFITQELSKVSSEDVSITYTYDNNEYTKLLENGWPVTIEVPSKKLDSFKVTEISGDAALVAVYKDVFTKEVENDSDISADRSYMNYYTGEETNTFNQSDIVKVVINWGINEKAIDNAYTITDYVPSGLVPIENAWDLGLTMEDGYWYRDIVGQKITFYVSQYDELKQPLYYYARVITPGTYLAEGIIMQGVNVKDSMYLSEVDSITIEE